MNIRMKPGCVALVAVLLISCRSPSGPLVSRRLSQNEMAPPPLRYQVGVDMWNRAQVAQPPPQSKPVAKWHHYPRFGGNVFVDTGNGVWYTQSNTNKRYDRIVRLKPDFSEDWSVILSPPPDATVSEAEPMIVLQDAVVCIELFDTPGAKASSVQQKDLDPNEPLTYLELTLINSGYLQCIDLKGRTRWRSEIFRCDGLTIAWRLPGNRIGIATKTQTESSLSRNEDFAIFSLEDGKLLESKPRLGFDATYPGDMPIMTPDGDYITYSSAWADKDCYVGRVSPDRTSRWQIDFPGDAIACSPCLSDDGILLCGTRSALTAIDINSGKIIWTRNKGRINRALGITFDGNFLCNSYAVVFDEMGRSSTTRSMLTLIDPAGTDIWSIDLPSFLGAGESHVIIYQDNSILMGYAAGFSLLNPDGSVRWTVKEKDMGLDGDAELKMWNFNPCPDGGLVVYVFENVGTSEGQFHLIGFAPGPAM